MEPGERAVELRCGRRIFVCTSSTLEKDPHSKLYSLYKEGLKSQSRPSVQILLEPHLAQHLGGILRFYETGSLHFVPKEEGNLLSFVNAAKQLEMEQLLTTLKIGGLFEESEDETQDQLQKDTEEQSVSNSEKGMAKMASEATQVSEVSSMDDEELIFEELMKQISDRQGGQLAESHGEIKEEGADPEQDRLAALDARIADLELDIIKREASMDTQGLKLRDLEAKKVELQQLRYEKDQELLKGRHGGKSLAFNLLVVGVTGTGKSSSLNTLLDKQVCRVSGAQAQGTRGCDMKDGLVSDESFVSFIDTQGLGADTSVTDAELLSQIMLATESINRMRIINNVLISFDTNSRATPATMANQLTLMELFSELRQSCFLILTKWNTNSVQKEWNNPLRNWVRKWRKASTLEEIDEDPPSYQTMYEHYCNYILHAMDNDEDAGAFSKMGTFLSFFEGRIIFMYNLDAIEIEDMESGDLDPHIEKMYRFYRTKALECLRNGSTRVLVDELSFLKEDQDTLHKVASRLVENRDEKIRQLEKIGFDAEKRRRMSTVFREMAQQNYSRIGAKDFDVLATSNHLQEIAELADFSQQQPGIGCSVM